MRLTAALFFTLSTLIACSHEAPRPMPIIEPAPSAPSAPQAGVDESILDAAVSPCDDFFQFACGKWLERTPIPADRAQWSRGFSTIDERNLQELHQILEDAQQGKGGDTYTDKIGAYYGACMNEGQIEATALKDLKAPLARIEGIKNLSALVDEVARLHLAGTAPLFGFGSQQDFKDATQVIGGLDQRGLGLPDRDYYLKDDGKFPELRKAYEAHVTKMLTLAGATPAKAAADALVVLKIERALAEVSMSRVDRRDPTKLYHRLELAGIQQKAPRFGWTRYLRELGHPDIKQINVTVPDFFAGMNRLLEKTPVPEWRAYLRWHLVHGLAPALSAAFVDENFAFYGKTLNGTDTLEPRWKRCVRAVDQALGEALGQAFVRRTFGDAGKARTREIVHGIEGAMAKNLDQLAWMDDTTRQQAHEKLKNIANKIGFPDRWRNYDELSVSKESTVTNLINANTFEAHRDLAKVGKPLDRSEWEMTPPTVNAYYNPLLNEMVFPAGILQPPFFEQAAPVSVNFGAVGMVMGHELTHGFDDQGRRFDAKGNMRDWWSPNINKEFERRAACVETQYSGYVPIDDLHLNGKLTLGENIADLGGLKLAHAAAIAARGGQKTAGKYSDDQLFFLGYAQAWCTKRRPENERMRVTVDPHSPPRFRVNGPLSNLPAFAAAFSCQAGAKMVRKDQCAVW
jgi:endothelin-converting enzyme/putative endopeptidase